MNNQERWILFASIIFTGAAADFLLSLAMISTGYYREGNYFHNPAATFINPTVGLLIFWVIGKTTAKLELLSPKFRKYFKAIAYFIIIAVCWTGFIHNLLLLFGIQIY
jgi:hypothetical protein